jgi:hypothetical protein
MRKSINPRLMPRATAQFNKHFDRVHFALKRKREERDALLRRLVRVERQLRALRRYLRVLAKSAEELPQSVKLRLVKK